jgi:hypothetical protein
MADARPAAPEADRLKLMALDEEDLAILSAHVQDAVLKIGDIIWLARERRLVLAINRFAWEVTAGKRRRSDHQRRRSALRFDRVSSVSSTGIDRNADEKVLSLLALRFDPRQSPSGELLLDFSGGATMRLEVECLEVELTDLGPAWSTDHAPRHILG